MTWYISSAREYYESKPRLQGLFVTAHFGLFVLLLLIMLRTVRKDDYRFWRFTRSTFLGFFGPHAAYALW